MRAVRLLMMGALGVLPLGCDQTEPPTATDSSYFPLVDGARYRYLHSRGGRTKEVEVEAIGSGRFEVHQTDDSDGISTVQVLVEVDGEVLRLAEEVFVDGVLDYSVSYDPGFVRFASSWLEAELQRPERRTYQRTETQAGQDPKAPRPRAHDFTIESVSETVTVPAGTFRNCVRVRRQRALDDPSIEDPTAQEEQDKLYWFAAGVGKVREENAMTGSSEVLISYEGLRDAP